MLVHNTLFQGCTGAVKHIAAQTDMTPGITVPGVTILSKVCFFNCAASLAHDSSTPPGHVVIDDCEFVRNEGAALVLDTHLYMHATVFRDNTTTGLVAICPRRSVMTLLRDVTFEDSPSTLVFAGETVKLPMRSVRQ